MTLAEEACRLYARRDAIARELADIDRQLTRLRSRYMAENHTCGIHPTAFRRAVETETIREVA